MTTVEGIDVSSGSTMVAQLRAVVPVMRELGVLTAFGITLGPEPPPRRALERALVDAQDERAAAEAARVLREHDTAERIRAHREQLADALGRPLTNAEWQAMRRVDDQGIAF